MKLKHALKTVLPVLLAVLAIHAHATPISVVSYDMPNGDSFLPYHDNTYNGSGDPNVPNAPLSGSTGQLTDGSLGTSVAPSEPSGFYEYVLWHNVLPTVIFDFGAAWDVDQISLHIFRLDPAAVHIPVNVDVSFSDDKINFGLVTSFTMTGSEVADRSSGWIDLSVTGTGRYLQLLLNNNGYHLAVDEIAFDGTQSPSTSVPDAGPGALMTALVLFGCCAWCAKRHATKLTHPM